MEFERAATEAGNHALNQGYISCVAFVILIIEPLSQVTQLAIHESIHFSTRY